MAKINTLIRKGYLLAGVVMAANIFVVNEMKASAELSQKLKNGEGETYVDDDENHPYNSYQQMGADLIQPPQGSGAENNKIQTIGSSNYQWQGMQQTIPPLRSGNLDQNEIKNNLFYYENTQEKSGLQGFIGFLLYYENTINFFGGLALSGANNYFKWWDYSPGVYKKLGCIGWRSKRLLDIFQFDINLNLGRGILWLIPGAYFYKKSDKKEDYLRSLHVSDLIGSLFKKRELIMVFFLLQGFISMPLTVHIAKIDFSISISLDSMIWGIIGYILEPKDKNDVEEQGGKELQEVIDNKENSQLSKDYNNEIIKLYFKKTKNVIDQD